MKRNQAPLPGKVAALLRESRLFVLVAAALYLSLVLGTFSRADPGWSHSVAAGEIRNLGGKVGAWVADGLLYLFGLSAWWWVVLLALAALWTLRRLDSGSKSDGRSVVVAIVGFSALLIASSGVEALRLHSLKVTLPLAPGGVIGEVVARVLQSGFGFTGATLILVVLFATTLSLFTGVSWLTLMEHVGAGLEHGCLWVFHRWQSWQDRKAGAIAAERREAVVEEKRELLIEEHAPIRIEPPVVEIPKSSRVQRERQEPLFRDLPDTPLPPLKLLDEANSEVEILSPETLEYTSRLIEKKLGDFGVQVKVLAAYPGPVITRYEIEPAVGVKGSQIVNLVKDLARALSVYSIRVVETIPGKSCMGLEIPNPHRQIVRLSEIVSSRAYHEMHSPLTLALGKDIAGNPVVADLARMPHLLVAGTTGSGKSVALNAMILSILYKTEPREVRLVMVDPKMLELSTYQGIPHLLAPVVTDMRQAANALNWCIGEVERRYRLMTWVAVRNLSGYNHKVTDAEKAGNPLKDPETLDLPEPRDLERLPHIVVIIDELADLMMVSGKKVEELIARLAQKARAAGIHLILATQRPSVDVITGLIKANVPTRIAFQVSSKVDSRTILDQQGAESLIGQGDMLYLPPGSGMSQRVHGAYVADHEVQKVVEYLKSLGRPEYVEGVLEGDEVDSGGELPAGGGGESDPLYDQAVEMVLRTRRASISLVQRHLRIGYNRAARLIEQMEQAGLVSAMQTNGNREVLVPARME
ncbi:MAG TPA: DNA translocase FtsK 4TM domain-containing protein [Burkholderiales bacterium]|nr:DNA translocase FtsK 4TM domain-containing protein [Burkholderiales bacterium]